MLKKLFVSLFVVLSVLGFSQDLPYSWKLNVSPLDGNQIKLQAICSVDSGWHIYSLNNPEDTGVPVSIKINPSSDYTVVSEVKEPQPITHFDDVFQKEVSFHEGEVVFEQIVERKTKKAFLVNFEIETQACQDNGTCTRPETASPRVEVQAGALESKGVLWVFWAGLLAGFVALLTPCVFPMIPLTVTFFTKRADSKKSGIFRAVVYGLSIIVIYVGLGFGVTALLGEEVLNKMASSAIFNLIFFAILSVFAVSFLGVFEITLPGFLVNKVDAKADKGGWVGIFFMAFALALVSFSCTGPLIGTLLVEAAVNGGVKGPLLGMLGFSFALALPFTLFAIFPNWLNSLPKSGGWLNSVKVVLGFLEIALALKFLSNADLVYQAHIISREVFIVLWVIVFALLVLYLLGKIHFAHDSKMDKIGKGRKVFAGLFLVLIIYLIPGVFGAPLKMLSGVLPPTFYKFNLGNDGNDERSDHCPNNLECYHDYKEALTVAQQENKPLLLDFTGWTCVNCRYMEQNIWSNPTVDSLIRNHYVIVSLYVDDKKKLPENEQHLSERTGKQISTYGDKWADFEIDRYGAFTQPLYVLVDGEEQQLVPKQSYDTRVSVFVDFLRKGIEEYKGRMAKSLLP